MTAREYRHQGFSSDEEFVAFHQERAHKGDEASIQILATRRILNQASLRRESLERLANSG